MTVTDVKDLLKVFITAAGIIREKLGGRSHPSNNQHLNDSWQPSRVAWRNCLRYRIGCRPRYGTRASRPIRAGGLLRNSGQSLPRPQGDL